MLAAIHLSQRILAQLSPVDLPQHSRPAMNPIRGLIAPTNIGPHLKNLQEIVTSLELPLALIFANKTTQDLIAPITANNFLF